MRSVVLYIEGYDRRRILVVDLRIISFSTDRCRRPQIIERYIGILEVDGGIVRHRKTDQAGRGSSRR